MRPNFPEAYALSTANLNPTTVFTDKDNVEFGVALFLSCAKRRGNDISEGLPPANSLTQRP
jgi:hypothetical protein